MNERLKGVVPRIVSSIFEHIENAGEEIEFMVNVSLIEIYMEEVKDLLNPNAKKKAQIRESPEKGIHLEHVSNPSAADELEVESIIAKGNSNRKVGRTNMNAVSSRSHMITIINITQTNTIDKNVKRGKLFLVDLAGSERAGKTGATGETLAEGALINKSLLCLGNVINSLTENKPFIPYRNSKLTRLLQDSLGGNSRTTLIVTCSPSKYNEGETISTLKFGVRAKLIKNKPTVNEELSREVLLINLSRAELKIKTLNQHVNFLKDYITDTLGATVPEFAAHSITETKTEKKQPGETAMDPEKMKEYESKIKSLEVELEKIKEDKVNITAKIETAKEQNINQETKINQLIEKLKNLGDTNNCLSEKLLESQTMNKQLKSDLLNASKQRNNVMNTVLDQTMDSKEVVNTKDFDELLKNLKIDGAKKQMMLDYWEGIKVDMENSNNKAGVLKSTLNDLLTNYQHMIEVELPALQKRHVEVVESMRRSEEKGNIIFNDKLLHVLNVYMDKNVENENNLEKKDSRIEQLNEQLKNTQATADLKIKSLKNKIELLTKAVNICVMKIEEYKTKSFQQQPLKLEINFNEFDDYYSNNFQSIDPSSGFQNVFNSGNKVIKLIRGKKKAPEVV